MHLQSSTSKLPPCPSPASSIGQGARKLLGSSAWNSTACASIREVVRLPQNCKAARQPLRDSGQQAQRCHSSCPTTVTVHCHQNSPSPVGHWAPRSGAAASPGSCLTQQLEERIASCWTYDKEMTKSWGRWTTTSRTGLFGESGTDWSVTPSYHTSHGLFLLEAFYSLICKQNCHKSHSPYHVYSNIDRKPKG